MGLAKVKENTRIFLFPEFGLAKVVALSASKSLQIPCARLYVYYTIHRTNHILSSYRRPF